MNRLFAAELDLPTKGKSLRVTQRPNLPAGKTVTLFDERGPGCVLHWWLTYGFKRDGDIRDPAHDLRLKFFYDNVTTPAFDISLAQFFAILLDRDIYPINSAPIKVLPKNAVNCYFPIPFKNLRITLENQSPRDTAIWFMADYHKYPTDTRLTPLRFQAIHHKESPAQAHGSFLMADLSGQGFVAGMVKGVSVQDKSDAWYHTGGDLYLLDGESDPHALRGIGGEDIFNMSFGIWDTQTDWVGAPYIHRSSEDTPGGSGYEGVMYRFFGPDPIFFDTSALIRFGSKTNTIETVVYAYLQAIEAPQIITPETWQLAGPFDCPNAEAFLKTEWADDRLSDWPQTHTADFGQYQTDAGPTEFAMPVQANTEHGWCDFTRYFRGRKRTNVGTQPCDVSAYAVATIDIEQAGGYVIELGYDDTARLWINGNPLHTNKHAKGFDIDHIACHLPIGSTEIRIKLSNTDNRQWRLWAFSFIMQKFT